MRHPKTIRYGSACLSGYPTVRITLVCTQCPHRRGVFNLARLAHHHGPDISLDDLFDVLVRCKWHRPAGWRPPGKYEPRCFAQFAEWVEAITSTSS